MRPRSLRLPRWATSARCATCCRVATFAGDPWPYGVEANRPTLEALVRYMAEQSLMKAPIPVEELFVPIYGQ